MAGRFESGYDVAALRRFTRLTQAQFARAMGISVHALRNWEQGRRGIGVEDIIVRWPVRKDGFDPKTQN